MWKGSLEKKKPPGPKAERRWRAPEGARRYVRRRLVKLRAAVEETDISRRE
jgi:hypothetical protein